MSIILFRKIYVTQFSEETWQIPSLLIYWNWICTLLVFTDKTIEVYFNLKLYINGNLMASQSLTSIYNLFVFKYSVWKCLIKSLNFCQFTILRLNIKAVKFQIY